MVIGSPAKVVDGMCRSVLSLIVLTTKDDKFT